MSYSDWKAVYVDKTTSLKAWQATRKNGKINPEAKNITFATWFRSRKLSAPVASIDNARFFDELQVYWRENYNVEVADDLSTLDYESVREVCGGIEYVLKEFPKAARFLKEIKAKSSMDLNAVMSTEYCGRINLNVKRFSDRIGLKISARDDANSGYHPKNSTVASYGIHEAGHILMRALIDKYGGRPLDWNERVYERGIILKAWANLKETTSIDKLRAGISGYATKDYGETVAEAIVDCVANKGNASPLSKGIWSVLKEELK